MMKLSTFVPSYTIQKEGLLTKKDTPNFREKYEHFQSIKPNYIKVEEFLDAPIHRKNAEVEKWRLLRQEALTRINAIEEMEYNELSEKIQKELESSWKMRAESNREMDRVMKDLTNNHIFYRRIRKVVKRLRHISKRVKDQGPVARIFPSFFTECDQNLLTLYHTDPEDRYEINYQLTELDLFTHNMKRISLVTGQVARYFLGWAEGDLTESLQMIREDRLTTVLGKISSLQMDSTLTEANLIGMTNYMELLVTISAWDPREGLQNRIFLGQERQLASLRPDRITELKNQFADPVQQFIMENELILYDDDLIISGIAPVEKREELFQFETSSEEIDQFLLNHTTGERVNCTIHVSEDGHYFLVASRDIEVGDSLRSRMTPKAFLKWLGKSDEPENDEKDRVSTKIAQLEKERYRYDWSDLERVDLTLRIKFLKRFLPKQAQKKVILSDDFSL